MCHRLGRERDGVLRVEVAGYFEGWRYASTSTRLVSSRTERLRSSGVVFFVGVLFSGVYFFIGSAAFRGTVVVSRGVSALNLCGATRTRADLRTAGVGRGFGGEALRGVPVAISCKSGGAGRERRLNASLNQTGDERARPVVESRERVVS